MYFYIVDPSKLNQKSYERVQNQLYSCLSEYRISGEISRVTQVRRLSQLVESALDREVKTLVAVGTDETLQEMINCVKGRDVTLAYIPVMQTELSKIFGLPDIETACKTIAARRIEQLDLGVVNDSWFLTRLNFGGWEQEQTGFFGSFKKVFNLPTFEVKFSVDEKYSATIQAVAGTIINARVNPNRNSNIANPTDSVLDVLLVPNAGGYTMVSHRSDLQNGYLENIPGCSVIHLKRIQITSPEGMPLKSGDRVIAKTPATIEILPQALKMIVGRDRTF